MKKHEIDEFFSNLGFKTDDYEVFMSEVEGGTLYESAESEDGDAKGRSLTVLFIKEDGIDNSLRYRVDWETPSFYLVLNTSDPVESSKVIRGLEQ